MTSQELRQITEEKMWTLHCKLAEHFLKLVEGEEGLKGSTYDAICGFLKENGINLKERAPVARGLADIQKQIAELPFPCTPRETVAVVEKPKLGLPSPKASKFDMSEIPFPVSD